jgi:hypothetical protein
MALFIEATHLVSQSSMWASKKFLQQKNNKHEACKKKCSWNLILNFTACMTKDC